MLKKWLSLACLMALGFVMAACSSPPSAVPSSAAPFEQDVLVATDQLMQQWRGQSSMPAFLSRLSPKSLMIAPFVDSATGDETMASSKARQLVASRVGTDYTEFKNANAQESVDINVVAAPQYLLSGSLARSAAASRIPAAANDQVLTLSLVEVASRTVVARSEKVLRNAAKDSAQTAYFQDSPVLLKDESSAATAAIAQTAQGGVLNSKYLDHLGTQVLLDRGQDAYANGKYYVSLKYF